MNTFRLLAIDHLTDNTFKLKTEWTGPVIKAGQCFNVGLPGTGVNREYSMYSNAKAPFLEFLIKEVQGGIVSTNLKKLSPGDLVDVDGPYGEFIIKEPVSTKQKFLFICSGTGIAPFHSFVQTYPELNYQILHGIRYSNEQYDRAHYRQGCYIPCISKNDADQPSIRVTDYLIKNPVDTKAIVYLCGNKNMIIDVYEILRNQGLPGSNIFEEVFF